MPGLAGRPGHCVEAYADPEVFANKTVGQVAAHYAAIIGKLDIQAAAANLNPWTEAKVFVQLLVQSVGLPARQGPAAAAAVLCQNVQSAGARGSGR